MKRELTKDEILAQLAEKERRIQQHLQGMKDQGEVVSETLKVRAESAGEKVQELAEQARELAPVAAGVGLGLWVLGRMAAGMLRRRQARRLERMSAEEIGLLSDALARRLAPAQAPPRPVVIRRSAREDFVALFLAAAAGALVKTAADRLARRVRGRRRPAEELPEEAPDLPAEPSPDLIARMAEETLVTAPRRPPQE